jgi:hypothetical protein
MRRLFEPYEDRTDPTRFPSPYYEIEDWGNMYRTTAGWYFDGESSVKILDFKLDSCFWWFMTYKMDNLGSTLISGDIKVRGSPWDYADSYAERVEGAYPGYQ